MKLMRTEAMRPSLTTTFLRDSTLVPYKDLELWDSKKRFSFHSPTSC